MGTGGCDDRQGDGLSFRQPCWAPSPAPERCRRKTNVSISPEEFGCPGPSQLGTGTGASAMHCHSLEQGSCGATSPIPCCTPSQGWEQPQGTAAASGPCRHVPLRSPSAENRQLTTLVSPHVPGRSSHQDYFPRSSFFPPGHQHWGKKLIPSQGPWVSWHGCGPTIPWSPLSLTPQDVAGCPWRRKWQAVTGKLLRHGDTLPVAPVLGTLASCSPSPATPPSIISSFPARVIGGLVTDRLINSLISSSSLPVQPPAQVGTNPAGLRDERPGPPCPIAVPHGGTHGTVWTAHVHTPAGSTTLATPRGLGSPKLGCMGGPSILGRGDDATLPLTPLPAVMPPWQVPTVASRCAPFQPHPARVCSHNGGGVSAPLCRQITGVAATSEAPAAQAPLPPHSPNRAAGRGAGRV